MIKLQSILDLSSEQMDKIPSPFVRVRELEQENELLLREVVDLRRQLAAKNPHPYPDLRDTCTLLPGGARSDREASHCRTGNTDGVYIVRCSTYTTCHFLSAPLRRHLPPKTTLHLDQSPFHSSPASSHTAFEPRPTRHTRHGCRVVPTRMARQNPPSRRKPERRARCPAPWFR